MTRYGRLLTDAQWEKIRPLLPKDPKRPRGGTRRWPRTSSPHLESGTHLRPRHLSRARERRGHKASSSDLQLHATGSETGAKPAMQLQLRVWCRIQIIWHVYLCGKLPAGGNAQGERL